MTISTEIDHPSHHHKLNLMYRKTPYTCDGCNEPGSGTRYRCDDCDYDLHKECALAESSKIHPFYKKCSFEFLEEGRMGRYCDACGGDVHGFVYHCYKTGHDLHPRCANLPHILKGDGVKLRLHESVSSKCGKCGSKRLLKGVRGWSYRSTNGDCQFHVSCVKAMLAESWEKEYFGEGEGTSLASLDGNVPNLHLWIQNGASSSHGKTNKYWKMVKVVVKLIISAIIGDPSSAIVFIIESLVSN